MIERKPPAVNPNAIVFNPKANAKDAAQVARQSRKINRKPLSEREAMAAEAIAAAEEAAATRTSADDDTEQVIGKLADGTSSKPPRVEAPSERPSLRAVRAKLDRADEVKPPLNLNETHKEFDEPEDVSGDPDDEEDTAGFVDGDEDEWVNPELDEQDIAEINDDDEEEEDDGEYSTPDEIRAVGSKLPGDEPSGPRHVLGNDVPRDDDGVETLPEGGGWIVPDEGGDMTKPGQPITNIRPPDIADIGHDVWSAPLTGYQSFVMGDRIKVRNPLTGESVLMALVSVDWDGEELECHVVYRPVTSSEEP